jgi:deazaflavin-dependent oxidoreductase (nitroreductase family)
MAEGPYLRPPWFARVVGNRMAVLLNPTVRVLSVRGRTSGRWRSVAVVVLEHAGQRYLLAPSGNTDWSKNLRASGRGRLRHRGRTEEFSAVEVPVQQRQPLIETYLRCYGRMPRLAATFRKLPDPADHPAFRIVKSEQGDRRDRRRG